MEGVSFALRQALELSFALGGSAETISSPAAASRAAYGGRFRPTCSSRPLVQSALKEQASVGAALTCRSRAEASMPTCSEACDRTARYGAVTTPDQTRVEGYDALYQEYTALYPKLRDDFHFLARFF